jgi:cytochrome c peroxidase
MFWDLRAADLETQVLMPIQNNVEMGMPSLAALTDKLKTVSYYPQLFKDAFGSTEITPDRLARALAQFLRSITSFNSKYDQGLTNNFSQFTPQELNGLHIIQRDFCLECHSDLTHEGSRTNPSFIVVENSGQNTGLGSNDGLEEVYSDKGIGGMTGQAGDMGTFKIPTLRNIELTAPYMHDGRFQTLDEVIEHYSTGIKVNPNMGIQIPLRDFILPARRRPTLFPF